MKAQKNIYKYVINYYNYITKIMPQSDKRVIKK